MDTALLSAVRERARRSLETAYARLKRDAPPERPVSPSIEQLEARVRSAMEHVHAELSRASTTGLASAVDVLEQELASLDAVLETDTDA
jgi:hypothetical protein